MTLRLAPLDRADAARCARLERELFAADGPWSEDAFLAELDKGHFYVGAYLDGADGAGHADGSGLVGYAGMSLAGRPPEADVHTIGVDPRWQRRGIGGALLRALLDRADSVGAAVFLEVRTDNTAAIELYLAHGFERIGLRRRYYQPSNADAYTMARPARRPEGAR